MQTDKQKQYRQDYYQKNKAKIDQQNKQRYYDNKSAASIRRKNYLKTVDGKYSKAKENAKRRNIPFYLTIEEYKSIILINKCHYCCNPLGEFGYCLDRKNNEPVYNIQTVVPCCYRCNVTFMDNYEYDEKIILAETIKDIDVLRRLKSSCRKSIPNTRNGSRTTLPSA